VQSWADPENLGGSYQCLSEHDWPMMHKSGGTYVWFPAPAAAPAAVEWMACSIHKHTTSIHIMIVPRLMMAWWFKILNKTADLIFKIPTTTAIWGKNEHEPLICALCLPLSERILGHIKAPKGPSEFTGSCIVCGYRILEGRGLFCTNFWVK